MSSGSGSVLVARDGKVLTVTINRPQVRNAVDSATARSLGEAFQEFERDPELCAAVLSGAGGAFCAGFDLREVAEGHRTTVDETGSGPAVFGVYNRRFGVPLIDLGTVRLPR